MMLPRMLLHRPPGGGLISKSKLEARFVMFNRGNWTELIRASAKCDDLAAVSRRRLKRRVARAEMLVHYGELFSARQALEGASLAPGNQEILNMLRDESRRPPRLRDPLPEELLNFVPEDRFELDEDRFCRNLRSARRGAARAVRCDHGTSEASLGRCQRDAPLVMFGLKFGSCRCARGGSSNGVGWSSHSSHKTRWWGAGHCGRRCCSQIGVQNHCSTVERSSGDSNSTISVLCQPRQGLSASPTCCSR